eukprot:scaffold52206_cov27-Tisochrysis_lutea.AAC.2
MELGKPQRTTKQQYNSQMVRRTQPRPPLIVMMKALVTPSSRRDVESFVGGVRTSAGSRALWD